MGLVDKMVLSWVQKKHRRKKNGTSFSPAGDLHLNSVCNLRIYKPLLTLIMISKGHC